MTIYIFHGNFLKLACGCLILIVLLTSCVPADSAVTGAASTGTVLQSTSTDAATKVNQESTVKFSLTGANEAQYTWHNSAPISKLRHGHYEFTIDVTDEQRSIFIVFYGYQGPGKYTLSKTVNGGDVHISFGSAEPSWDLSLQPTASCAMTVHSDTPTALVGIDRMQGTFSCPRLLSSDPNHPQGPVTVSNGSFDIAIIVES